MHNNGLESHITDLFSNFCLKLVHALCCKYGLGLTACTPCWEYRKAGTQEPAGSASTQNGSTSLPLPRSQSHLEGHVALIKFSLSAFNQIKSTILEPLLSEDSVREIHPLVEECFTKICAGSISTLREVERTLLFSAVSSESLMLWNQLLTHNS